MSGGGGGDGGGGGGGAGPRGPEVGRDRVSLEVDRREGDPVDGTGALGRL